MSVTTRVAVGRMLTFVALAAFILVGRAAFAAPVQQSTVEVKIQDFKFEPPALTVAAGTSVTWTNLDSAPHTASSSTEGKFETGNLNQNELKAVVLNEVGTFEYICAYHPRMLGTVTVTAGGAAPAAPAAPAASLPNTGMSDNANLLAGFGLVALLAGLALIWGGRRPTTIG